MHLADFSVGSLGESGIVGSAIPVATGAALAAQVRGNGQVALCFFGDGAANEGVLHESMNLAGVWQLPVVYFCENNDYAVTVPRDRRHCRSPDIADARGGRTRMPGVVVDGQDVLAVLPGRPGRRDAGARRRRPEPGRGEDATGSTSTPTASSVPTSYRDRDPSWTAGVATATRSTLFDERLRRLARRSAEERRSSCATRSRRKWTRRSSSPGRARSRRPRRPTPTSMPRRRSSPSDGRDRVCGQARRRLPAGDPGRRPRR